MIELDVSGKIPSSLTTVMIADACSRVLRKTKQPLQGSVSISFVTDDKMQSLNRKYRKKNRTTDVLSFSELVVPNTAPGQRHYGDIFVSPAYVKKEATRRKIAFGEELLRMIVHGMLHLIGYDHATEETELEMFGLQEEVLAHMT